jgi:hypothetical protein
MFSKYFPMVLLISLVFVVISYLSSSVLLVWVLPLISLVKGLSIIFIFSKN